MSKPQEHDITFFELRAGYWVNITDSSVTIKASSSPLLADGMVTLFTYFDGEWHQVGAEQ